MSTRRLFGAEPEHHQFYRNSFKQLSDIQQRQVGMLLGAAVADAATRSYELMDAQRAQAVLSVVPVCSDEETAASRGDLEVAFPPPPRSASPQHAPAPGSHHASLTGAMYYELLKVMMAARGAFSVDDVAARWVAVASARRDEFQALHGRLVHTVPLLSTLPCVYPYADDMPLWEFVGPFAVFLSEPLQMEPAAVGPSVGGGANAQMEPADVACPTAPQHASLMAVQSVALRYLQCNPDPLRNAAFQCKHGGADVFPEDYRRYCPQVNGGGGAVDPLLVRDAASIAHALDITRRSKSYAHGIRQVIRAAADCGNVVAPAAAVGVGASLRCCGPAMLVGALLGAKFGVRNVPLEWISATRDHHAIGTMCIEICQWAWNPSSR